MTDTTNSKNGATPVATTRVSAEARTVLVERLSDAKTKQSDFTDDEFEAIRQIYCEDRVNGGCIGYLAFGVGGLAPLVFFLGLPWWWLVAAVLGVLASYVVANLYWESNLKNTPVSEQHVKIQAFYIQRKKAAARRYGWLVVIAAVVILAVVSVPSFKVHEEAIRIAVKEHLRVKATDSAASAWEKRLTSFVLGPDGTVDVAIASGDIGYVNAYVCSFVYLKQGDGTTKISSLGFLGHVWLIQGP